MDINVTLFGEMLTFAVLVWAMMKYIWPPLIKIIEERQQKIAAGLEAAERGKHELELTRTNIVEQLQQAKKQAAMIVDQAIQKANEEIAKGRVEAEAERVRILAQTRVDLEQEVNSSRKVLEQDTVDLVIAATEKILQQHMNDKLQKKLVDQLIASISPQPQEMQGEN